MVYKSHAKFNNIILIYIYIYMCVCVCIHTQIVLNFFFLISNKSFTNKYINLIMLRKVFTFFLWHWSVCYKVTSKSERYVPWNVILYGIYIVNTSRIERAIQTIYLCIAQSQKLTADNVESNTIICTTRMSVKKTNISRKYLSATINIIIVFISAL